MLVSSGEWLIMDNIETKSKFRIMPTLDNSMANYVKIFHKSNNLLVFFKIHYTLDYHFNKNR